MGQECNAIEGHSLLCIFYFTNLNDYFIYMDAIFFYAIA